MEKNKTIVAAIMEIVITLIPVLAILAMISGIVLGFVGHEVAASVMLYIFIALLIPSLLIYIFDI